MEPHQLTIEDVISSVKSDIDHGLSQEEVNHRLRTYGYNILPDVKRQSLISIFISQFKNPLIYILLIAASIIFFIGKDKLDAFIISGVLLFNAILGTVQEGRSLNILESLKRLIKTDSIVLRNGTKMIIEDSKLVPGDIIFLQEGQKIPADARVIESNNIQVDEALLTGESIPVYKTIVPIENDIPIGDQHNMIFKGTSILAGSGKAVVINTGIRTKIGSIHQTTRKIKTEVPLKKELDRLSYWILLFILIACMSLFVIGLYAGKPIDELLIMLTALFICVIPEGLPVVLTLVLVTGAFRMAKHFVLVKNMRAVETLGRTDVIVIDKTGTLTRNEMMVSHVFSDNTVWKVRGRGYHPEGIITRDNTKYKPTHTESSIMHMGIASSLLNRTEITYQPTHDLFTIKGDPTEAALFVFSKKLGISQQRIMKEYKKIYEIPFSSKLQFHAGFFQKNNQYLAYIIGSPEAIIQRSNVTDPMIEQHLEQLLEKGLRTVAIGMKIFAYNKLPTKQPYDATHLPSFQKLLNNNIQFLGLIGIEDAIRSEVPDIIQQTRNAGLNIIMATGDHKKTALYVAKKVGIYQEGDDNIGGAELKKLSDAELSERLDRITVYSRVSPEHKMRIINLLHKKDKIVAMTGDGINDAPSLVAADLGIAMGGIGTEVAKQASDLILLDDSFVNIIYAIEQGRHIFYTIKRVILYFFATNTGEILIILFAFILSLFNGYDLPLPITAGQILWLNLVTDGFLDVGLSMEPKEPGLLHKRWLTKKPQLIDAELLTRAILFAVPMAIGSLFIFLNYYQANLAHARTMTLVTLAMFQWFNAWNCRSTTKSVLFQIGIFTNKWLIIASLFVLFLQGLLVYTPIMQHIFKTTPLSLTDWFIIICTSIPLFLVEELRKIIFHPKN